MSKIIELKAENVKVLKAIEIKPEGNIVELTGKNGQGKSSVLDAIVMALAGKKYQPEKPVREGQEEASIEIDIGNLLIKRKIKADGSSIVKVESKDGAIFKSPQALLDELFSNIGFDPLKFANMKSKEQFEELKKVLNISFDFDMNEAKRKGCYDERTYINRELKELESQEKAIIVSAETPDSKIIVSDLLKQLDEIRVFNTVQYQKKNLREKALEEVKRAESALAFAKECLKECAEAEPLKDETELVNKINSAEEINSKVNFKLKKKELQEKISDKESKINGLTLKIDELSQERKAAIQSCKMPVEGLSFGDGVVLYNEIPLDQCSQGEKIKISTSIAMSDQSTKGDQLKVILIKDGSLLDEDNMKVITEMAKEKDYQVWIEKVDSSGKIGIVIEDGEVKSIN